jgi:outer membrane protein insertion porin family
MTLKQSVRAYGTLATLLAGTALASAVPTSAQEPVPVPAAPQGAPDAGIRLDSVVVVGNQRVGADAIRVTTALQPGQRVTGFDIQNAIRRLMATGDFANVEVRFQGEPAVGGALVFQVTERPLIARIDFEGLERVSPRAVRDTLKLQDNQPLNPNLVLKTEQMIRDLLAKEGVQLLAVDTALTPVSEPAGAYRLTFNVREGSRLSIAEIEFQGNQAFTDEALREAIETKEEGFLWFRTGKFDRERFQEDLRNRLPTFYGEHGYIDFNVVSDTLVVDPQTGKARLQVTVNEGPRYRLGEFAIEGASRFPTEELERMFTAQRRSVLGLFARTDERQAGEVFNRAALDDATTKVQQLYKNEGYLYAQVLPQVERVPATEAGVDPVVNITWAVSERTPFYIDKIFIQGNSYTHESVIRDRLLIFPGDVYNEDRLLQSYRNIAALGFFETPLPTPNIDPNPEEGTVDLTFTVAEKQTGSINFGTSIGGGYYGRSGGVSGFLGYSQPNLFGQAKQADLRVEYGWGRSSFTTSYTDPAVLGTRNSASVSLFHTDDRWRGVTLSEGRYMRTGGSFRWGFPIPGLRWTRAFAGYSLSKFRYEARDVEECSVTNIFCQPSAVSSSLSATVTRDTKNHPLFPTAGTRQSISLEQSGGILGGDGNFQKLTADTEWWIPVGRLGGGAPGSRPIITSLGVKARTGAVFGDASAFPFSRFFLGGTQWGETLRGYDESELTPLGFVPRGVAGFPSTGRLGNAFLAITGEYAVRLNDNLSVSLFADAGNIWSEPGFIDPTRLFRSAGIGGSIVTPFGPLGIDLAYGFDRPDPGWKFHFKINPAGF